MFQVGDEIEHIGGFADPAQFAAHGRAFALATGDKGIVTRLWQSDGYLRMWVSVRPNRPEGWGPRRWRKVQRRNLKTWLATENTIEGPKRVKEKV